jgi:uncharacterized SAM-binding protein YcdF (DUF218 family)
VIRKALIAVAVVLAVPVIAAIVLAVDILIYAMISDPEPADAAIVLGAAVYDDEPTPVFEERLRHAVELYRSGRVKLLIMTGGAGPGDTLAESEAGREWATANGVPEAAIVVEAASQTTKENFTGVMAMLEQRNIGRVLVVSDPLHLRRATRMAAALGLDAHPSPTPTTRYRSLSTQLPMLLREVYFSAYYLMTGN